MDKRINHASSLCIVTELYKAITDLNIMPTDAKVLIKAVENGIQNANKHDAELQGVTSNG